MIDLRQLECFFAVAEELHFGRAAARLRRSQTSVSDAVRAIERDLGGALFLRTTRRVRLTSLGERCALMLRPSYDRLSSDYQSLRRVVSRAQVGLAYTPQLGQLLLPHWVRHLLDNGLEDLVDAWTPSVLHSRDQADCVLAGSLDLGLCWDPRPHPVLHITPLATCPVIAIMRSSDPLSERSVLRLDDLRDHRLLVSPARHHPGMDARVRTAIARSGLNPAQVDEVEEYDQLGLAVIAGTGIGLHPATIVAVNRVPGLAFRRLVTSEPLTAGISLIRHRENNDPRVIRIEDILAEVVQDAIRGVMQFPGFSQEGQAAESDRGDD